jgi:hypothetical protein
MKKPSDKNLPHIHEPNKIMRPPIARAIGETQIGSKWTQSFMFIIK